MLGRSWLYVGAFFALGRFLCVFFASCCVCSVSWSFFSSFCGLRARFWRVLGGPGKVLEAPGTYFSKLFGRKQTCTATLKNLAKTVSSPLGWRFYVFALFFQILCKILTKSGQRVQRRRRAPKTANLVTLEPSKLHLGGTWEP